MPDRFDRNRTLLGRWRLVAISVLPATVLVQWLASYWPATVESAYSRSIYPLVARGPALLTGWLPFSVVEALVLLSPLAAGLLAARAVTDCRRRRRSWTNAIGAGLTLALAVTGIVYGFLVATWGLNYQRLPLADSIGLDRSSPTAGELRALCRHLIEDAARLREQTDEDGDGVMRLGEDRRAALRRAGLGYRRLARDYSFLDVDLASRPKGIRLSRVLTLLGIGGIYSGLTGEPNINMELPDPGLPSTICHELAHQVGFAREDEASFIGYLACRAHPDADFRYGGAFDALTQAMGALARADREAYLELLQELPDGIVRDWQAQSAFWRKYETPVRDVGRRVNDAYLKSQGQAEGIRTYGMMVDLLIADHRRKKGSELH